VKLTAAEWVRGPLLAVTVTE
jgi:hypothetical protein